MIEITIPVEQIRIKSPLNSVLAKGTKGCVKLCFVFSKNWRKFTKKACGFYTELEEGAVWVPMNNNTVFVPDEFLDKTFYIQIAGQYASTRMMTGISQMKVNGGE